MDFAPVKKWAIFFIGILCAIIIADALSNAIVSATGMVGWIKFLVSFILYAVFFFSILYALEVICRRDPTIPLIRKYYTVIGNRFEYIHGVILY